MFLHFDRRFSKKRAKREENDDQGARSRTLKDGTASFHVEVDIEDRLLSNNSTSTCTAPTLDEIPGTDSSFFGRYHGGKPDYLDTPRFSSGTSHTTATGKWSQADIDGPDYSFRPGAIIRIQFRERNYSGKSVEETIRED